jgi:hypothetical protein
MDKIIDHFAVFGLHCLPLVTSPLSSVNDSLTNKPPHSLLLSASHGC